MREFEKLLPNLAPPTGGLVRLQRQVRQPETRPLRHRRAWLAAGLATACALLLALPLTDQLAQHRRTAALLEALRGNTEPGAIRVTNGAALELASDRADVRIYLVQSDPPKSAIRR